MKTVFVTGGTGGIGSAVVRAFAQAGYRTAVGWNRSEEKADELIRSVAGTFAVHCDTSDSRSTDAAVKAVLSDCGHLDVLVNCAGISVWGLFDETDEETWRRVLSVNLDGVYRVTRAVVPSMIRAHRGSVVNIGSIWGETGASCEVAYSASKAGVIGLTKALAKELAPGGITVNCVSPGVVDTPMMSRFTEEEIRTVCEEIPLGRQAKPEEIADAVLFAAEASYMTGQVLGINGGMYI